MGNFIEGGVRRKHLSEGGTTGLPGARLLYVRTLNLIKAMTVSIDLILAQGLNMQ